MSLTGESGKQYGLIIKSNKANALKPTREIANVFDGEDDQSDEEFKQIVIDPKKETFKAQMKKSTKVIFDKALVDDPSIFEYDEVYDSFAKKDETPVEKEYKPKYINKLLKSAGEKKLERELQNERKAQREIQAEKDLYGDKEEFVTSSYKKKMEEIKELVEKRDKENALDEQVDVTKQSNINAFYRYMYHNSSKKKSESPPPSGEKNDPEVVGNSSKTSPVVKIQDQPGPSTSKSSGNESKTEKTDHKRREFHRRPDRESERNSSSHRRRHHSRDKDRRHNHEATSSSRSRRKSPEKSEIRKKDFIDPDVRRFDENGNEIFNDKTSKYWEKFFDPSKKSKDKNKSKVDSDIPEGFVRAKPRVTTDEQLAEYRSRYLQRKSEGLIKAQIVASDDEFDAPLNDDNL